MNKADQCKETLKERGWAKGYMEDHDGQVCMLGAIIASETDDLMDRECIVIWDRNVPFMKLLGDIIEEQFPERSRIDELHRRDHHHFRISQFNDHSETTLEDVELVLDKASVRLDELV